MFTSRAEYRLQLREDNADLRLTEHGRRLGVVDDARWDAFARKRDAIARERERLQSTYVNPQIVADARGANACSGKPLEREYALTDLLRRPGVTYASLMTLPGAGRAGRRCRRRRAGRGRRSSTRATSTASRTRSRASSRRKTLRLPPDLDYRDGARPVDRGAAEAERAASRKRSARPRASPGITPAAISLLLVHLKRGASAVRARAPHDAARRGTIAERRGRSTRGARARSALRAATAAQRASCSRVPRAAREMEPTYNLTAIREPARMVTHHLLDALAVLPHLPQRRRAARARRRQRRRPARHPARDRAAAMARRAASTRITRRRRSSRRPRSSCASQRRPRTRTRVEDYAPTAPFDVVISRAFADLATFAEASARHRRAATACWSR